MSQAQWFQTSGMEEEWEQIKSEWAQLERDYLEFERMVEEADRIRDHEREEKLIRSEQ